MSALEPVGVTAVLPYRRVAWLQAATAEVTRIATGWFFGDFLVVTARHTFDGLSGMVISVWPGRDQSPEAAFGRWESTKILTGVHGDYAGVILPQPVGQSVGTFGIANLDLSLNDQRVEVAGYEVAEGPAQLHGLANVVSSGGNRIEYDLLTLGGLSGAPVWLAGSPDFLVGMHVESSAADRFSEPMVQEILRWRDIRAG